MTATLVIPFAIGETIWWVGYGSRTERMPCPECCGSKVLTLIQGNGVQVSINCACCGHGYEEPRGWIEQTIMEHRPTSFTPRRVDISGATIRYSEDNPASNCWRPVEVENLFRDEAECARRCEALNEADRKHREKQSINHLASKRRDMAWSVHYWGRRVTDLRRDLELAESRLDACKARKKVVA